MYALCQTPPLPAPAAAAAPFTKNTPEAQDCVVGDGRRVGRQRGRQGVEEGEAVEFGEQPVDTVAAGATAAGLVGGAAASAAAGDAAAVLCALCAAGGVVCDAATTVVTAILACAATAAAAAAAGVERGEGAADQQVLEPLPQQPHQALAGRRPVGPPLATGRRAVDQHLRVAVKQG